MTTTSDARKRLAEATDPHAACKPGRCEAGDRWRSVSCAGGGGGVEALTADVVCTNCEADDLGCTACGAHGTLVARPQRPEGVTVTEWKVDHRNNGCWPFEDVYAHESTARFAANGRPVLSRQRTTFPDVVTEWAEVSGDTEAGGDR